MKREYLKRETANVDHFLSELKETAKADGATFDSAAAVDFVENANIPENLKCVLDECETNESRKLVTSAILDGCRSYESAHGCDAPADIVELAIHNAFATTQMARSRYQLDSASNLQHDPLSLQPNRAVIAILTAFAEGIPFAHYLPADIGSNEAKLAILTHRAGNKWGAYELGALLDGVNGGNAYLSTARCHTANPDESDGTVKGKITAEQITPDTCYQSGTAVKLLRGRTIVYVNGFEAARETSSAGAGVSTIAGKFTLGEQEHAIGGTINPDTGEFSLTTTPKMPKEAKVTVEGFIDLERAPESAPSVISQVETFSLHANAWQAYTRQTIDARTQMSNELGLDPYSESVMAIQTQFALERHYQCLAMGMRLAMNNVETFDFKVAREHQDSSRAEVWRDLSYHLGALDQTMAERTMDHGISHIYVGKRVAAQLKGLPNTFFQPSGVVARPGIYRLGRLFGRYEVYYTPKIVAETENSAQMLCVGRASNVALNPVVLGDAVAPMVMPLSVNNDLRQGAGFYARNFTRVNPYHPAANGFALLNVTNM